MAQPITRAFLRDLMNVLDLPAPVVEFGSMQVESEQDSDLRRFFAPADYTGTDFREGPGVDRVEDLRALSFEDGSVGTALSFDTLEHCEDPPMACRELTRVTADGGVCVISSVMLFGIHGYPNDYFRFTPEGFRSMLSGFDDVRVVGVGDPGIPREVFGVGVKGRSLDGVELERFPTIIEAQRRWDDPSLGVKVGPLRVPVRELASIVRREMPSLVRARLAARRGGS
jgi:SAM-dependent methyltransferase